MEFSAYRSMLFLARPSSHFDNGYGVLVKTKDAEPCHSDKLEQGGAYEPPCNCRSPCYCSAGKLL